MLWERTISPDGTDWGFSVVLLVGETEAPEETHLLNVVTSNHFTCRRWGWSSGPSGKLLEL